MDIFDQFRYITGALAAVLLFSVHAAPRRGHFRLRLLAGYGAGLLGALAFLPLLPFITRHGSLWGIASAPYWLCMSLYNVAFLMLCFEMSIGAAFFRGILASTVEGATTTVIRYLVVMIWFPGLPAQHPALYIAMAAAVYAVLYGAAYRLVAVRMQRGGGEEYFASPKSAAVYIGLYLSYITIFSPAKIICENIMIPLREDARYWEIFNFIQYFCVGMMLLISAGMLAILYHIYENVVLQKERCMLEQLLREKKTQYEFVKENIDMINRKCHELKHQLKALEARGDAQLGSMIRQVGNAVNFYDATVKTGNEVLDTILTEKSLLCAGRGIELTCMANTGDLAHIQVLDLYTILDNALGNAMECAMSLHDPGKRLISFMITTVGDMIYISVENYYEGEIKLQGGYPVAPRPGKGGRGYGLRSIHMLARRYGGDIQVCLENQIFQLQIILPA